MKKTNQKSKLIIGIIILLIILLGFTYAFSNPSVEEEDSGWKFPINFSFSNKDKIKKKETIKSVLTGREVSKEVANKDIISVVVENHPLSRPQAGLSKADIVIEAIAEMGITRFIAFFQTEYPDLVGPVRSARLYFLPFVEELGAAFAHVGGNRDALERLKENVNLINIDEIKIGGNMFWRDKTFTQVLEHTMYTSVQKIAGHLNANYQKLEFKPQTWEFDYNLKQSTDLYNLIDIDISNSKFHVSYEFNEDDKLYYRSMAHEPHLDLRDNQQIAISNIIIMFVESKTKPELPTIGALDQTVIGSGEGYLFNNGGVKNATWVKTSNNSRLKLNDENGEELVFMPGKTWIHIVPNDLKDTISFRYKKKSLNKS